MSRYTVTETVTLLWWVEADNEGEALRKVDARGCRDFDEIDCSPSGYQGTQKICKERD